MTRMNVKNTPRPTATARKITFIDDDRVISVFYVAVLREAGFEVRYISDFLEAEALTGDRKAPSDLYVIDLMMPAPKEKEASTSDGLASGLCLIGKPRQNGCRKPVILLSNLTDRTIWTRLPLDANTRFAAKFDTAPFELVDLVKECLHHEHN